MDEDSRRRFMGLALIEGRKGVRVLQRAGIEVSVGLLADEAREDLRPHLARADNVVIGGRI